MDECSKRIDVWRRITITNTKMGHRTKKDRNEVRACASVCEHENKISMCVCKYCIVVAGLMIDDCTGFETPDLDTKMAWGGLGVVYVLN